MKLLFTKCCNDVFRLYVSEEMRKCKCGKSGGRYIGNIVAEYFGDSLPLGFSNDTFVNALQNQPNEGWGKLFEAFVIAKTCPTFIKKDSDDKK